MTFLDFLKFKFKQIISQNLTRKHQKDFDLQSCYETDVTVKISISKEKCERPCSDVSSFKIAALWVNTELTNDFQSRDLSAAMLCRMYCKDEL